MRCIYGLLCGSDLKKYVRKSSLRLLLVLLLLRLLNILLFQLAFFFVIYKFNL